jgi:hypothetical protein
VYINVFLLSQVGSNKQCFHNPVYAYLSAARNIMDFELDEEEDLSTVLGTESLAARDMVSEGFDNTLRARGVLELTQLGRWYTTRPYTGRQAQAGRPACCER